MLVGVGAVWGVPLPRLIIQPPKAIRLAFATLDAPAAAWWVSLSTVKERMKRPK